jgi:signal transduction histidine kinase
MLVAIIGLWLADIRASYESPALLIVLSLLFATAPGLVIATLFARLFMSAGALGLLMLGCGALAWSLWGLSPFVAMMTPGLGSHANEIVTLRDATVMVASLCYLAGAVLIQRPPASLQRRSAPLIIAYASILGMWTVIVFLALRGWTPVFFIEGAGASLERQFVLATTIFALGVAILLVRPHIRESRSNFLNWFVLALQLLAVGCIGLTLLTTFGGVLGWVIRATLFLGGAYMLIAALTAFREAGEAFPVPAQRTVQAWEAYAVAIAFSLVAAVLRLVFLQQLEMRAAFLTFYPVPVLVALYGAWRAGLLATLVSAALVGYFWMPPARELIVANPVDWVALIIFILGGALMSWSIEKLHRTQASLRRAEITQREQLERMVAQRTSELVKEVENRKRAEEALLFAKVEAERATLAKSKFLAAASHDLRQPVQSLTLVLAAIKRMVRDKPEAVRAAALAKSSVDTLNDLLNGILDISRLDAGVVTPSVESVDLGELIEQLAQEYSPRAARMGLAFRSMPRVLHARTDAALLERIIRNLIENALRYTAEGGILIGLRPRGDFVRIDVIDTGIGIPDDKHSEIFEEFRQLSNPARDASRGLGLGLAIVSRLARLLGIEVEVASKLDKGTRFSLLLPLDRSVPTKVPAEPLPDEWGGRFLVIEDNADVLHAYEIMLHDWGYETIVASSGEEAIERAAQENWRFDAILADHRLGSGLTGAAAAAEIARRAARSIPTLVVTGDTSKEQITEICASGFAVVHKPVGDDQLRRTLAALLRGELAGLQQTRRSAPIVSG